MTPDVGNKPVNVDGLRNMVDEVDENPHRRQREH